MEIALIILGHKDVNFFLVSKEVIILASFLYNI